MASRDGAVEVTEATAAAVKPIRVPWVRDGDVVDIDVGIRGGGGDGGSTGAEDRRAWLDMYLEKKPDAIDPRELKLAQWTRCQLSGEPLREPCVCDGLGRLYNKESVIKHLLAKSMPDQCKHIRNLNADVREVHLTKNPEFRISHASTESAAPGKQSAAPFICPISDLEMNGRFRFFVIERTGDVVSARAIKEAREAVEEQFNVKGLKTSELIPLNGTDEEVAALRAIMENARKKKKGSHQGRKKKTAKLGGKKRTLAEAGVKGGKDGPSGKRPFQAAAEMLPEGADREVFASIFTSSQPKTKETFCCRNV